MATQFQQDGIRFLYPENWDLQREETASGWTLSLQSPDTAFMVMAFDEDMPEPGYMARTVLEALQGEYKELEFDDCVESVAGQPAVGHDIRFYSFDLTNSCWIRSFYSGRGTVLLMWQVNDLELDETEKVLRAIAKSMEITEEENN